MLINNNSGSAAELLAKVVQLEKRGTLIMLASELTAEKARELFSLDERYS